MVVVSEAELGEIRMYIPPPASRCLCFTHPLLQAPPEWEGLGAKLMGGRLSHPFCHLPRASTSTVTAPPPLPRFRGTKVIETGVSFEFKHFTKSVCSRTGNWKQSLQS